MVTLDRRQLLHGAVSAALVAAGDRVHADVQDGARATMGRAATAFLAALDPRRRQAAMFPFGHDERQNWHYIPRNRNGIPFKDLTPSARAAAHELMQASLSALGYAKAVNVVRLEEVLRQTETFGGFRRDPERYHVTVFGTPAEQAPWGWRLEGHHLSLNFSLVPGRPVAVTPAFFGANPAEVRTGPHRGLRALGDEQDLGLALARNVDRTLHGRLVISADSPGDIVTGPGRADSLRSPTGVALGDLASEPRALAVRLIETFARNMRSDLAEAELRRAHDGGIERVHVAWAGPIDPRRPHYYRLHGPTLLIEYDNSQGGANHVHTVWHDPRNDFAVDVLQSHYQMGGHERAPHTPHHS